MTVQSVANASKKRAVHVAQAKRSNMLNSHGGETNLCHNAVDRHLVTRAEQPALIALSSLDDPNALEEIRKAVAR